MFILASRINYSCDGGEEEGVKGRLNFGGEEGRGLGFFPV